MFWNCSLFLYELYSRCCAGRLVHIPRVPSTEKDGFFARLAEDRPAWSLWLSAQLCWNWLVPSRGLPKFCTITSSNLHNTWPVQTRSLWTWSKLSFRRLCYSLLRLSQSSVSKNWRSASSTRTTWVPVFFLWAPQSRRDPRTKSITNCRNKKEQVIWAKNQPNRLLRVPSSFMLYIFAFIFLLLLLGLLLQLFYWNWEKQVYFLHVYSIFISYTSFSPP